MTNYMKRQLFTVLFLLLGISFYGQDVLKNVVVLHSYNSGLSWTDNITKGILDEFKLEQNRTVNLRFEYMDAKNFENKEHFKIYEQFISQKYQNVKIDLIICVDNPAFDFLQTCYTFKGVPVVFCGLNYADSIPKGYTGVMEDVDFNDNIQTILNQNPNYNKLYIVIDKSITGQCVNKKLDQVIAQTYPNLKYEYVTNYSLYELEQKLTTLKNNDVLLMLLFNFDRLGKAISYDVILDILNPYCKVPIYGVWDFYLGKGIVGGKITNAYKHGLEVSQIAKEVLAGVKIDSIPVISGPTQFMFDYNLLTKYRIQQSSLPKGSIIINTPYNFIQQNKTLFVLLVLIFALLVILVFVLVFQVKSMKTNLLKERVLVASIETHTVALNEALAKAEMANRLKTKFLSNISHEIRTPMNSIIGFSNLLVNNDVAEMQMQYIQTINSCGNQLMAIIDDIVNISLIESHQISATFQLINVNEVLNDLAYTFNSSLFLHNNKIEVNYSLNNQEAKFFTDELKFRQIMTNILSNATKFTDNGLIEVGYSIVGQHIILYVKDNGIGIEKQYHDLIFERFWQVDHSNAKVYGGNGLGLAISKAYVEFLGGRIWVDSRMNEGAIFQVELPFNQSFN